MRTITVTRRISAPMADIFAMLADHEGYARWPGMQEARLEKSGRLERNGEGAVRYLKSGPAWFREEITVFEAPRRMDYVILASRLPLQHKVGSIRLLDVGEGMTEVVWTSTFRITLPLLGSVLTRLLAQQLTRGFAGALKHIDRTLAAAPARLRV